VSSFFETRCNFKFHKNRSRGLGAVDVENRPLPLTWPMAYTTDCTAIQTVIGVQIYSRTLLTHSLFYRKRQHNIFGCKSGKLGPFLALVRPFIPVLQIFGKVKNL